MVAYVARRVLQAVPTVLGVSVIGFAIVHLAPGDPVQFFAFGVASMTPDQIAALRHAYGLDQPLPAQYLNWLLEVCRLDFGRSFVTQEPVLRVIGDRLPATLLLTVTAFAIAICAGIALGMLAAHRPGSVADGLVRALAVAGTAVPTFWLGLAAILVVAVQLRLLPSGGIATLGLRGFHPTDLARHLLLPSCVLALGGVATVSRYVRAEAIEVASQDFVRTARAKGLSEARILRAHVARAALLPVATLAGGALPQLFGGAVVVETIFSWPGMGRLAYDAALQRDYPVILGLFVCVSVLVVAGSLLSDVLYGLLDPRIRLR